MRRVVFLAMLLWSWPGYADNAQIPDFGRAKVFITDNFDSAPWWTGWNGKQMLNSHPFDNLRVLLESSTRYIRQPSDSRFLGGEEKIVLTIEHITHNEKQSETLTIVVKYGPFGILYVFDATGEEEIGNQAARSHCGITMCWLNFDYQGKQVALRKVNDRRVIDENRIRQQRQISLSITSSNGSHFNWLGHDVQMVTVSANPMHPL